MQTLLLRLRTHDDEAQEWAVLEADGTVLSLQRGGLAELAPQAAGRRLCVLAPAEDVLVTQARIPSRSTRQLLKALPYALEDELAQDIDELHFAAGQRQGELTPVAVVDRGLLRSWLDRLRAAGLRPQTLLPELLSLPLEADAWAVLVEGDRALVRTGPLAGFATSTDLLADLLPPSLDGLDEAEHPRVVHLWTVEGGGAPNLEGLAIPVERETVPASGLTLLARGHPGARGLNLLQGEFSPREDLSRNLRPWYAVAGLALAVVLVAFLLRSVELFQLDRAQNELNQAIDQLYRTTFPDARRIVDPRVQMEQQLRTLRGGQSQAASPFLTLLDEVSAQLAAQTQIQIRSLSFRSGRLDLTLAGPSPQALDTLRQRLAERPGLQAELQSVTTEGDLASGQLRVSGGGI